MLLLAVIVVLLQHSARELVMGPQLVFLQPSIFGRGIYRGVGLVRRLRDTGELVGRRTLYSSRTI